MSTNRYETCCEILNKHIQNYFEEVRGLVDNHKDKRTKNEHNYIFSFKEIRDHLTYHKTPKILTHNIPVFNRNRIAYLDHKDRNLNIKYRLNHSNKKRYDFYILEHIGEALKALECEYVIFTWNLGCLGIKGTKDRNNDCDLYFYDMIANEWVWCDDELYNKVLKY